MRARSFKVLLLLTVMLGIGLSVGDIAEARGRQDDEQMPILSTGSVDACTERYNACVASCARQQTDCQVRGNEEAYCSGNYRLCANGCRNALDRCLK